MTKSLLKVVMLNRYLTKYIKLDVLIIDFVSSPDVVEEKKTDTTKKLRYKLDEH